MRLRLHWVVRRLECDAMGLAKPSIFWEWIEAARQQWFDQIGYSLEDLEREQVLLPLTELTLRNPRLPQVGDEIRLEVWLSEVTWQEVRFSYRLYTPHGTVAEALTRHGVRNPVGSAQTLPHPIWNRLMKNLSYSGYRKPQP